MTRIARFSDGGTARYGIVHGTRAASQEEIARATGIPVPAGIKDFVFDGWMGEVLSKSSLLGYKTDLADVRLLAPIPTPPKIVCLAYNYEDHASEQGLAPPKDPVIVIKPRTALQGSGGTITRPAFVKELDYEIELAIIIGKDCRNVSAADAPGVIFGYMILNDVSARDIQFADKQFTRAKGLDGFAPCGPWITTADEIADPQNLRMTTRINGETRQDSGTSRMSIKIPDIISRLSRSMTLERGDIISTGTPAGVALNSGRFPYLGDGDRISMEIEGLGTLESTVRADS